MAGDVFGKAASDRRCERGVTIGSHYDCIVVESSPKVVGTISPMAILGHRREDD